MTDDVKVKSIPWPDISINGMFAIRRFSEMNPWIDFIVLVDATRRYDAEPVVNKALTEYWDGEFETYGDALEYHLLNIPHVIIYHDSDDISDAYEQMWEQMLDKIGI